MQVGQYAKLKDVSVFKHDVVYHIIDQIHAGIVFFLISHRLKK